MVSGQKLCRLSQTPNLHSYLSLGAILFPLNASNKNTFFPKEAQCGGGVGHNQASSRSPPLLSFPLLSSHSFGAELSVMYAQPHFGFTETFKAVNFQLCQQHLHPGCRCRSPLNLPSLLVRTPPRLPEGKNNIMESWNGLGWRGP